MQSGIGRWGYTAELELRILAALTGKVGFLHAVAPHLAPGLFSQAAQELWAKVVLAIWNQHHRIAPVPIVETAANRLAGSPQYEAVLPRDLADIRATVERILAQEDLSWVQQDCCTWIRRQQLLGLAQAAATQLDQDPEQFERRVQRALQVGAVEVPAPVSFRASAPDRIRIRREGRQDPWVPTGVARIDQMLFGGLRIGKMGVILAPSRGGKTTLLLNFAVGAARAGHQVLFCSHEVQIPDLQDRLHTCMTGVPTPMLRQYEGLVEQQMQALQQTGGDIHFGYWVRDTAGVDAYHACLDQLQERGVQVSVVVSDYPTLWRDPPGRDDRRVKVGQKFAEFFQLCRSRQVAGWCGHQGNRGSHHKGRMQLSDVAEDWSIIGTTDVSLLVSATEEMEQAGRVRVTKGKDRDFLDGQSEELEFQRELQRFE